MSYCINPNCTAPDKNSLETNFCMACGAPLFLKDRYRALALLGQGGFGKTFKAVDECQAHKPLCVIKQFTFSHNDPNVKRAALELFYEEAQHLFVLGKHPQIPELFDYFDLSGQPYLVQQFIDGQNLQQEVATIGKLNQQKVWELLLSLLPVLDFLHNQSPPVIHRDLKPANIIRRHSDGQLVLVDFGAAKQATQTMLSKTGTLIGSPEFVAPEQTRGKPTFASDIYSLGVTCVYLLTQVSPFDLFDLSRDEWVWREYLVDNPVDAQLGKVLDKAIANALPNRYRSAAEVLAALAADLQAPDPKAQIRDFLAIDIDRTPRINTPKITAKNVNHPVVFESFGFETARLVEKKKLWGQPKLAIEKSSGTATRFFQNLGGGVRLQMVRVPRGEFLMGAPELEEGSNNHQRPQHRVRVPTFCMSKFPITQSQYEAVMGNNPSYFKGGDRPVETVSWHDAVSFCQQLSQLTNQHYRLPSEAEWEYACRASTSTRFYFGDTITPEIANYQQQETSVVGIYPANGFGLYDMHGNILEWCADKYHGNYLDAPTDGSAWQSETNHTHVLRGGSWFSKLNYCRSAFRTYYQPDYRCAYFGFRVVCSVSG